MTPSGRAKGIVSLGGIVVQSSLGLEVDALGGVGGRGWGGVVRRGVD